MVRSKVPVDADPGNYDSFHPVMRHPRMTGAEWLQAYRRAWRDFYSFDAMRRALLRSNHRTYWGLLKNYLWYRAAMIEDAHPMITGFLRLKDRTQRRRGFAVEGRLAHLRRRVPEVWTQLRAYGRLFVEMQDLWLQTRHAAPPTLLSRLKLPKLPARTRREVEPSPPPIAALFCTAAFSLALVAGRTK